jgi:hypothetical protein
MPNTIYTPICSKRAKSAYITVVRNSKKPIQHLLWQVSGANQLKSQYFLACNCQIVCVIQHIKQKSELQCICSSLFCVVRSKKLT